MINHPEMAQVCCEILVIPVIENGCLNAGHQAAPV
jgi:hypothetical protein